MFDGEMVKTYFPLKKKKISGPRQSLKNFWSKTKLDLENFHQKIGELENSFPRQSWT